MKKLIESFKNYLFECDLMEEIFYERAEIIIYALESLEKIENMHELFELYKKLNDFKVIYRYFSDESQTKKEKLSYFLALKSVENMIFNIKSYFGRLITHQN